MKKIMITWIMVLLAALVVHAQKPIPLNELLKPESLVLDGDRLYITEGANVLIYSTKDFTLQKRFGRAGEGPQDFYVHNGPGGRLELQTRPDALIVNSFGKISFYTKDGIYQKEIKTPANTGLFKPLGENFVGHGISFGEGKYFPTYNLHDANLNKIKEIHRIEVPRTGGKIFAYASPFGLSVYNDKIYITASVDFDITVFDNNGNKLYSITMDIEKVKITEEHKKKYFKFIKARGDQQRYEFMKKNLAFPEYFPAISVVFVVDDKIYAQTHKEKDGKSHFMILDLKGKLLNKVFLGLHKKPTGGFYPYTIKNGKYYQLIENEKSEKWELYIKEI